MKRMLVCGLALALTSVGIGREEEKKPAPTAEETRQQIETMFGAMLPMTGKMVQIMTEAQLDVLAKPESSEKVARYIKNLYDALIKEGFPKEDALRIVTSLPLPSTPSSK